MRILWVSHFVPFPPTGGVLQRGFGLVSGLSAHAEVHLLALNQPRLLAQTLPGDATPLETARKGLLPFCASIEFAPIPSESVPGGRQLVAVMAACTGRSYTEAWLWSPLFRRRIRAAIARVKPDIVHFDTISLAPFASSVPAGIRISLGHHNIESLMMRRRSRRSALPVVAWYLSREARFVCALEQQAESRINVQIVCSDLDAKRLRRLGHRGRIAVAENGVGDPEFTAGPAVEPPPNTPQSLAFVGRMSAYTNRDAAETLVAEIWPKIRCGAPNAVLNIVGSSPPPRVLRLAASDPSIKVWGFVQSIAAVLEPGTIFVCPIRDGGGTKLKVLDAMNRGFPIVAHPIALEGLDLTDGAEVLVARSTDEIAAAALRLIGSFELRNRLARVAFAVVREKYSFKAIASRLAAVFRSTCAGRSDPG